MRIRNNTFLLCGYFLALLVLVFPMLHERLDSRNLGFPLYYGSDFSHYLVRLEQGLVEPWSDTSNGIFSVPTSPPGFQPGGMEQVIGFLFSGTGWPAVTVMVLLSVLFGATVVPLLQLLLMRTGLSSRVAFAGGLFYFFLFLGPLQKFVHSSWSLPLSLVSLLLLWRFWDKQTVPRAIAAGLVLGLLPHVYFWGWTFVWCTAGLLSLFALFRWKKDRQKRGLLFFLLWFSAVLLSAPYFLHIIHLSADPLSRDVSERSSVIFTRGFESYPRSILTLFLALSAFMLCGRKNAKVKETLIPVVCICISAFVVLHQQFIHERVISFATHYYPYICVAALLFAGALIARWKWTISSSVSLLLCLVFLGAAYSDYHGRFQMVFAINPNRYTYQHFVTLLPILRADPQKEVILTDQDAALMVASSTRHDVIFTEHARHLLISTQEYAERYCLSDLFTMDSHPQWIAYILQETGRLGRDREKELYAERLATATAACLHVREDPVRYIKQYGVTLLLWDEKDHPEWLIDPALFTLEKQGEGWSLWRPKV